MFRNPPKQKTQAAFSRIYVRSVGQCDREFSKGKDLEERDKSIFKETTNHSPENTVKNIEGYQKIAVRFCKMRPPHTHTQTDMWYQRFDLPSASTIYPKN
jgi:hypothetical protein